MVRYTLMLGWSLLQMNMCCIVYFIARNSTNCHTQSNWDSATNFAGHDSIHCIRYSQPRFAFNNPSLKRHISEHMGRWSLQHRSTRHAAVRALVGQIDQRGWHLALQEAAYHASSRQGVLGDTAWSVASTSQDTQHNIARGSEESAGVVGLKKGRTESSRSGLQQRKLRVDQLSWVLHFGVQERWWRTSPGSAWPPGVCSAKSETMMIHNEDCQQEERRVSDRARNGAKIDNQAPLSFLGHWGRAVTCLTQVEGLDEVQWIGFCDQISCQSVQQKSS